MRLERWTRAGGLIRGVPAVVTAALAVTALTGAAPAGGAAHVDRGASQPAAGTISTVAGGVGGPAQATKVAVSVPCGVSAANGNVYIGAAGSLREVSPVTDHLTTPAGTGNSGPLGDGGKATKASLDPCGSAVDAAGNLVIADTAGSRIQVVAASRGRFYGQPMRAGDIYTIAGTGEDGYSGDRGRATDAELNWPFGVAVDPAGNVIIADTENSRVRVVALHDGTFYGRSMIAEHIYTVAGNGAFGFSGDGGQGRYAELGEPQAVAVDPAGNLLIADTGSDRIRMVTG
jgi:trimeric autotransporter adhesin